MRMINMYTLKECRDMYTNVSITRRVAASEDLSRIHNPTNLVLGCFLQGTLLSNRHRQHNIGDKLHQQLHPLT